MSRFAAILRYWHTVRYLRPVQFYGRFWFRMYQPEISNRTVPDVRFIDDTWQMPIAKPVCMLASNKFCFLNQTYNLPEQGGWNDVGQDKLWLYNLHYFDDLNAKNAGQRHVWHLALLQRWVDENPFAIGNGWEPYPTSIRIVNWVKWVLSGNELSESCLQSLAIQARWLNRRIEWHLLGNHLFANAKALVFAGLFFQGSEADAWLKKGLDIIQRELPEQVLSDGGNFERSTMYHAIFLEDMLDLINVVQTWSRNISSETLIAWQKITINMLNWLHVMCHPDDEIAFFNDAAFGIAATQIELGAYAKRLGINVNSMDLPRSQLERAFPPLTCLPDSGYIRAELGDAVALLDVAKIGPDYMPGHAHADTLSFELSLFGERVFVNSGTSCYGIGDERSRQRGTAAHNTVEINGQNSSEVWGGFRVARRAYPVVEIVEFKDAVIRVGAKHDGYQRLSGRNCHAREWILDASSMRIKDRVTNSFKTAIARFHVHPAIIFEWSGEELVASLAGKHKLQMRFEQAKIVTIAPSTWHPEFGKSLVNQCIVVEFSGSKLDTVINWSTV